MSFHLVSIDTQLLLYLDPGSGSLIVQLLLAALLGIGITVRLFWNKIRTFFGGKKSLNTEASVEEDDE